MRQKPQEPTPDTEPRVEVMDPYTITSLNQDFIPTPRMIALKLPVHRDGIVRVSSPGAEKEYRQAYADLLEEIHTAEQQLITRKYALNLLQKQQNPQWVKDSLLAKSTYEMIMDDLKAAEADSPAAGDDSPREHLVLHSVCGGAFHPFQELTPSSPCLHCHYPAEKHEAYRKLHPEMFDEQPENDAPFKKDLVPCSRQYKYSLGRALNRLCPNCGHKIVDHDAAV